MRLQGIATGSNIVEIRSDAARKAEAFFGPNVGYHLNFDTVQSVTSEVGQGGVRQETSYYVTFTAIWEEK